MSRRFGHQLTKEWAEKIAFEYVELFCFSHMLSAGCLYVWEFNDRRLYVIFMCPINVEKITLQEELLDTFIHELMHVFHYVWGLPQEEKIIKRKTSRFLRHHRNFTLYLFHRILTSSKCEGRYISDESNISSWISKMSVVVKERLKQKYGQS